MELDLGMHRVMHLVFFGKTGVTHGHMARKLIDDGRSLHQIENTFNILHQPTQCLRCWGFHVQKRRGNSAYELVNASIVIKNGEKMIMFLADKE
jgi:hypothetical protein